MRRAAPRLLRLLLLLCACACARVAGEGEAGTNDTWEAAPRTGRALACFWGLDRATDVTFASFQKYVLNVLGADLCAAVSSKRADGSGAWRDAAVLLDLYDEPRDYENYVSTHAEELASNTSFRPLLRDNFLYPTGVQQMYSKQRLFRLLQRNGALAAYDWFFFCRTDLLFLAPLADVRSLQNADEAVWVPHAGDKSDWGGLYDRAVLVPRRHVARVLNMLHAVAPGEPHGFLDSLRGFPGTHGRATNCEHFYSQYLAYHRVPVRRFNFSAFVTAGVPARDAAAVPRHAGGQLNEDTKHLYRYTDEYAAALNNALCYYRSLDPLEGTGEHEAGLPASHVVGRGEHDTRGRLFYVITVEQAERVNATLRGCALSAWAMAIYERLLSHPLRTKHVSQAHAAFAPPHFAWDLHWPTLNGNRDGNAARKDSHFPLPEEGAGYEPYGMSLATSCRSYFSPCGYEGCVPAFGANALRSKLTRGDVLNREGVLSVLEQLYAYFNLRRGQQSLVFYDSGAPGPVAYQGQSGAGGYDLPDRAYSDDRFVFALASSTEPRFRRGRDVSLPTPWTEDVRRYGVRSAAARTYFLTFKGNFNTSAGDHGGDLRARVAAALHDPARGVVIVDSGTDEGKSYDYRQLMYDTVFALILRGDQPYSYRYTEAVCSGSVPVLVASAGWVPPFSNLHAFNEYGVLFAESELGELLPRLRNMTDSEVERLRYAAKQFCLQHLVTVHQQVDSLIEAVLSQN